LASLVDPHALPAPVKPGKSLQIMVRRNLMILNAAIYCTLVMRDILVVPLCLTLVYRPSGVAKRA
jgi:hypothetical protein